MLSGPGEAGEHKLEPARPLGNEKAERNQAGGETSRTERDTGEPERARNPQHCAATVIEARP